jgi:hypothetical protein
MVYDEKLKKVCDDFSLLSEDQQNYILGILQALAFANSSYNQSELKDSMPVNNRNNS